MEKNDIDRFNDFNDFQLDFPIEGKSIRVTMVHLAGTDIDTGIGVIGPDGVLTLYSPTEGEIVYGASNAITDIQINES